MQQIKNMVALITGATSGIGKGVASHLAELGVNLIINGLGNKDEIFNDIKELENKFNVKTHYSSHNLADKDEVKSMVKESLNIFGKIDILVNNAGVQHVDNIEDFPDEKWDLIIAINLSSAFHTIKNIMPSMKSQNFGRIINIASAHGLVASPKKTAYVAAKHGIIGLTKSVALEVAKSGITCNSICPGWVLTPLVQKQIDAIALRDNISNAEASQKLLFEKQPSGEFVSIEQIASLVAYLISDGAKMINGAAISIDGAWTAQ